MKFNKLSKEKRNQLILVAMLTLIAMGGLGYGLIKHQYENLGRIAARKAEKQQERQRVLEVVRNAAQMEEQLATLTNALAAAEADMVSDRDFNFWVSEAILHFKAGYRVDLPQFSQVEGPREVSLITSFPYKQASIQVSGTARFHELGRFIADFENRYPHARILNLNLDLNSNPSAADPETLTFKMDIIFLVKLNLS